MLLIPNRANEKMNKKKREKERTSNKKKRKKKKKTPRNIEKASTDDEEPSAGDIFHVENVLPTGDFYTGDWWNNVPHGNGKFLWTDGCMYFGKWYKGKTTGKGRFSWPSGATYEGEFKGGYMDGKGTYTGSLGYTYRGLWVMNFKHGSGTKSYGNGDYYDGDWRRGSQEGHGKYQWKSGNLYIGQWRNGRMHGNGTMIWKNGDRYDGSWEYGVPKGNGTFKWADGSFYVGIWSQDSKDQNGSYYPSSSLSGNLDWVPQELFALVKDCKVCPCEKVPIFPSQKMPHWKEMEPGECTFLEGGKLSDPSLGSDSDVEDPLLRIQPARRQGETISKGHKNYELMLNLQLGIRHAVGRPGPAISLDLKPSAFDPKEKVWTKFPPEGSKHTPPHQSSEFRWKDYCPLVFRTLRKLFNVDAADYMLSICGDDALRELSSPGKSGSFFYLTDDDKYMIKTMKKAEAKVLLRMLPAYYNHVKSFANTLVTKFFGLHCVRCGPSQKKVRFIIMGNLFCTDYAIHRRFDLKGSSHGRTTAKPESEIDATTTLKDLDLNFIFRLHKTWFQDFCRQVDKDCELLEQERIMDYSMLIGLHFREVSRRNTRCSGKLMPTENGDAGQDGGQGISSVDMDQLLLDPSRLSSIKLGIEMPARIEKTVRKSEVETQLVGEPTGELYEVIIFFGIIDILQDYDISKKLEHAYKSMQYDPTSISAVDPKQYSRRFRDFIFRVFVEDS